jgi:hypothetical protein
MTEAEAVQEYQCPGCSGGPFPQCYIKGGPGIGCSNHHPGTMLFPGGTIFLGMPKGFNRVGNTEMLHLYIFPDFDSTETLDMFNIAVWKYRDPHGNTLVRGLRPRLNQPFLWVILDDCMDQFHCVEILQDDIDRMD